MNSCLKQIDAHGVIYEALMFCCPGCAAMQQNSGLHMLAVNSTNHTPTWQWDGNFDAPTLTPSILTRTGPNDEHVCHSYLKAGVFEFLGDCTHRFVGQHVPMLPLPSWVNEDE